MVQITCFLAVVLSLVATVEAAPGFKPNASLTVNTWTNANDKWFSYPEQSAGSDYFVPTLNKRPNFGIAVSGGGYRAVTLALGWVRGLYMLNLVQQSRYLSSNSGGSWFNSAFSYQSTVPVAEFLGPYIPPQNLTRDAMRGSRDGKQGAFAATIANAVIKANALVVAVKDTVVQDDKGPGAWSDSIGNAFLAPYELNNDKSTFSANGTLRPIHTNLNAAALGDGLKVYRWQGAYDAMAEGNVPRPFPIVLGSLFNHVDNMSLFFPCEFTPQYIGIPPVFPNEQANKTVGGGFVDPVGFNSFPPDPRPRVPAALAASLGKVPPGFEEPLPKSARGRRMRALLQAAAAAAAAAPASAPPAAAAGGSGGAVREAGAAVNAAAARAPQARALPGSAAARGAGNATAGGVSPREAALNTQLPFPVAVNSSFIVPLKVAAGISSSFLSQGLTPADSDALKELTGTEELQYWNKVNFQGMKQAFADGGGTDNLAITPLIRRKVKHIVTCVAASEHIAKNMTADDWAMSQWDIASLFGAVPLKHAKLGKKGHVNGMPPKVFNAVTQVFPKSGWNTLFNVLRRSMEAGGPATFLAEYPVQANPYQAVTGGWKVKVLWVVNSIASEWEDQLPQEIQADLAKSRHKKGGLEAKGEVNSTDDTKGGKSVAELKAYPYVSTFDADYDPQLTTMLSQQATWSILALRPQLQQLLAGSGVTVGTPVNVGRATSDKNVGVPSKGLTSAAGASVSLARMLAAAAAVAAAVMAAAA